MPNKHPRPWRRDSVFGDGSRAALDRNSRARFRFLIHAHRRARRLTRAGLDVGEALVKRLGENGRLDPSYATLAKDADRGPRTVGRSLAAMRALGLLRWTRRLVRNGPYVEQGDRRCTSRPGPRACNDGAKAAREWMQDGCCHLTKSN